MKTPFGLKPITAVAALGLALGTTGEMRAELVIIDTVLVGDAGNDPADEMNASSWAATNLGYGAVGYDYRIGTTEVTISQYATFLNAKAATDPHGLWDSNMSSDLNIAGISRSGTPGSYNYSVLGSGDRPITWVSWFDAARFSNWLHNGATASADTESTQNYLTDARAYDTESFYGTYDQGGNVTEWNDGVFDVNRGLRGGSWNDDAVLLGASFQNFGSPSAVGEIVGFRVATVPEPSTAVLILLGGAACFLKRYRKFMYGAKT